MDTESWLNGFRDAFSRGGGQVVETYGFHSGKNTAFLEIAHKLLLTHSLDSVLMIANSVDSALLSQQIRKLNKNLPIFISDWGATERLIELGGSTVEGAIVTQLFDRNSIAPRYQNFHRIYQERFGQEPGFVGVTAFDATNVVLDALTQRQPQQNLKEVILTQTPFEGVQHPIPFDTFGDTQRRVFISQVRDGQFVIIE